MKNIILATLTVAFSLAAPRAQAEDTQPKADTGFTTFFEFRRFAADGVETIVGNVDRDVPISLPPAFSAWTCVRTKLFNDGRGEAYQSIHCRSGDVEAAMSVMCSTTAPEGNAQSFSLRRRNGNGEVSQVTFTGICQTVRNATPRDEF